jgi:hypothetical protein
MRSLFNKISFVFVVFYLSLPLFAMKRTHEDNNVPNQQEIEQINLKELFDKTCKAQQEAWDSYLWEAIQQGDLSWVKACHKKGANIHDTKKYCPMLEAAKRGHLPIIQYFLSNGVAVDQSPGGYDGETPLNRAAKHGHCAVALWLLNNKADVNSDGRNNRTPLFNSVLKGHQEITKLLTQRGANINGLSSIAGDDWMAPTEGTPLHCAVRNKDLLTIKFLVLNGANVNFRPFINSDDQQIKSVFMYAIGTLDKEIVQYLLLAGATPTEEEIAKIKDNVKDPSIQKLLTMAEICSFQ